MVKESQRARPCCKDGVLSERIKIFPQLLERACVLSAINIYTPKVCYRTFIFTRVYIQKGT